MTTMTFDTLKLLDKLKAAGFPQEQAEAVIRVLAEAQDEGSPSPTSTTPWKKR